MTESDKPGLPPSAPPPPYPYPYGGYPGSYPPPPPQPYTGYAPPPAPPKNGLGVAALVLAVIALLSVWSVIGGIVLGLIAVILGFVARGRVRRREATNGGVAIAGIVLGFLAIVISLVFIAIWVSVFNEVGGGDYVDCLSGAGSDERAVQQCADQFRDRIENEFSVTIAPTS
ncbi:MAG: DUF4190 domain-containing protein [Actinobacteria bacterium]|nr:DUF4190 domain-containing protein [Actinomycetota bacterium]